METLQITDNDIICDNISKQSGELYFAGVSVKELAKTYKTPLYIMDEDKIRAHCRMYTEACKDAFRGGFEVLFASKACSFRNIYRIMADENMWVDTVSSGELYTARSAGFDTSHTVFHSNNKTDEDISFGMDCNVGYFAVDCIEELYALDDAARRKGRVQNILLRITPGIDPHTFAAVSTGKVDSKFGFAIATNQAREAVKTALLLKNIRLCGYHCHIGSQIFSVEPFLLCVKKMLSFCADMQRDFGFECKILDLGGGFGVRYTASDPEIDIPDAIAKIGHEIESDCCMHGIPIPKIFIEPGRSIVADAGMTVYTVGSSKSIPEYKNYVSVDGGMTDNIRYALYGSKYTFIPVENADAPRNIECTVAGRCCESGDLLGERIMLPEMKRGELLCVATTGAYNYSMASNYNRIPRASVVMIRNKESYLAVKRETYEDLCSLDV